MVSRFLEGAVQHQGVTVGAWVYHTGRPRSRGKPRASTWRNCRRSSNFTVERVPMKNDPAGPTLPSRTVPTFRRVSLGMLARPCKSFRFNVGGGTPGRPNDRSSRRCRARESRRVRGPKQLAQNDGPATQGRCRWEWNRGPGPLACPQKLGNKGPGIGKSRKLMTNGLMPPHQKTCGRVPASSRPATVDALYCLETAPRRPRDPRHRPPLSTNHSLSPHLPSSLIAHRSILHLPRPPLRLCPLGRACGDHHAFEAGADHRSSRAEWKNLRWRKASAVGMSPDGDRRLVRLLGSSVRRIDPWARPRPIRLAQPARHQSDGLSLGRRVGPALEALFHLVVAAGPWRRRNPFSG